LASAFAASLPIENAKSDQPSERLESYHTWLYYEYRQLSDELAPGAKGDFLRVNNAGDRFHWVSYGEKPKPRPSTRAAAVLAAVGCDWHKGRPDA
jgi:hypothetical protein